MRDSIFIAKDVVKKYGNYLALNNINISVPKGSIYGLLGPNGAGKTTLMRIINQITAPDSGSLIFNGNILQPLHVAQIGYLPEERGLYKKMKVGEQALYLAQLKGMTHADAKKKLKIWFEKLDITQWWNKRVEELSKGMAQKIQFIVTVLHQPKLLIFDEPFSGFDPINAQIIKKEILDLRKKGTTIILSTHRMESVEEICDYIALINNSKTILEGHIEDIKKKYINNSYDISISSGIIKDNDNFTVTNQKENDYTICLTKECNQKDILKKILEDAEIISFKKKLPTMEEIFIKAVNNG